MESKPATGRYLALLTLGALGVVYGDIGTSPLYALRECFAGSHPLPPTRMNVLGVLSLIFWSLLLIVSLKYLAIVLRATNRGEGGILALMALAFPKQLPGAGRRRALLIGLGVFGAALLYGDGMLTPAISVLSAVEGLNVATPAFEHFVIPHYRNYPHRPVRRPKPRHRQSGRDLRAGHGLVVFRAGERLASAAS